MSKLGARMITSAKQALAVADRGADRHLTVSEQGTLGRALRRSAKIIDPPMAERDRGADGPAMQARGRTRAPAPARKAVAVSLMDRGADGPAMLCRPTRQVETAVAGITATQTADGHMIDRLHNFAQINDRQYEAALRLLEMCTDAGLMLAGAPPYGRVGGGGEMADDMAEARAKWNRIMGALGSQRADLLTSLCHERHPGTRYLATVQSALIFLADRWGITK